jgi:hypothetical protein
MASNFFKEYEERELRRQEIKKFSENKESSAFSNTSLNEVKVILDAIERGINNDFKKIFKVSDEFLQRNEFQDVRNLRITKFIKKLRMNLISHSIMQHLFTNEKTVLFK